MDYVHMDGLGAQSAHGYSMSASCMGLNAWAYSDLILPFFREVITSHYRAHLGFLPARNSSSGSCLGMMPGSTQAVMKRNTMQRVGRRQLRKEDWMLFYFTGFDFELRNAGLIQTHLKTMIIA